MKITQKKSVHRKCKVYDLCVEGSHTYNVEGVAVHNSSAGSLVNYLLDITQIDPIKNDIIFERFLSMSREGMPDIDSDFSDRDTLVAALQQYFGEKNVLYISNFNTLKLKSLVKDVSKFFGIDFDEVNAVTKVVEDQVKAATVKAGDDKNLFELKFDDAMAHSKPFKEFMDKHPQVCDAVQNLHKQPKSIGRHAGGILILENPERHMPVIRVRGHYQSPWVEGLTLKTLEQLGFLKFDCLGLDTLRIIQRCITYILQKQGNPAPTFDQVRVWYETNLHPDKLDMDDAKVYQNVYHEGRWPAIFQFTQGGAQGMIQKFKPTNVIDIATATSIYRPGPLNAHVDELYLESRNDPTKIKYKHPLILEVLSATHGAIIFQEQVMELAHKVGGFTLDEADKVRKAVMKRTMTGKDAAAIKQKELGEKFVKGAVKNGLTTAEAEEIWADMLYFSGYGFNKCCTVETEVNTYSREGEKCVKMMKDVQPGDLVLSREESNQKNTLVPVKKVHFNGRKKIVEVKLKTGQVVRCTMDHKFRTTDGRMLPLYQILKEDLSIVVKEEDSSVKSARACSTRRIV